MTVLPAQVLGSQFSPARLVGAEGLAGTVDHLWLVKTLLMRLPAETAVSWVLRIRRSLPSAVLYVSNLCLA